MGISLAPHPCQHRNFNHSGGFVVIAHGSQFAFFLTDEVAHFCMGIGHLRYFVIWLLKSLAHFSIVLSFSYWFVSIFNILWTWVHLLMTCVAKYSFCRLLVNSLKNEQRFLILMIKSFVDSVSVAVSVLLCPIRLVFLLWSYKGIPLYYLLETFQF